MNMGCIMHRILEARTSMCYGGGGSLGGSAGRGGGRIGGGGLGFSSSAGGGESLDWFLVKPILDRRDLFVLMIYGRFHDVDFGLFYASIWVLDR